MATPESRKLVRTSDHGIYKRGTRYVVVYRDPVGRQRKQSAKTLAEARTLKVTLTADVKRGEYRALSRVSFVEYAPAWIKTYNGRSGRGVGECTCADYAAALGVDPSTFEPFSPVRGAIAFFGRMRLAEIELRHVKTYAADLTTRGLAPASVAKYVAPIRALFATALEEGLIGSNPTDGLRLPRRRAADANPDAEEVKALTEAELDQFLRHVEKRWVLFFDFLSQTGLRIGEAIELRYGDIEGCWLTVARRYYRGKVGLPKGRKTRRIRITEELARELWQLRKDAHAGAGDLVFTTERGKRIGTSNLMSRTLKPAAVRAGLRDWVKTADGERAVSWVGFHTFRHTCATRLFRGHWDDEADAYVGAWNASQVCKFLGHTDPGFTLRTYVHLLPEDLPTPVFTASQRGNSGATEPTETGRNKAALSEAATA